MAALRLLLVRRSATTAIASSNSSCMSYLFGNGNSHLFTKSPYLLHFSTASAIKSPSFSQDFFIEKYQFSSQVASKAASFSARSKNPQNADLVLSFLRDYGFSNSQLERLVRTDSRVLSMCLEKRVKPKLQIFQDFGISAAEIPELFSRDFSILNHGANGILRSLSVLRRLLGSNDNVIKLIKKCPNLFYVDPEKTRLPNIEFLKSCGVKSEQINACIYTMPTFFLISPEHMRRSVHKVDDMGIQRSSRMFIRAVRAVSTMSNEALELKLKSFRDMGFSENDILRMFRSNAPALAVSTRKIKEVRDVLLETGKYDMSCIVNNPTALTMSVEKRYKPRLQILKDLEEKSLIKNWPALSTLYTMSNKKFSERFVAPYIHELGDVGEVFIAVANYEMKTNLS